MAIKVSIVDDDESVLSALKLQLEACRDFTCVGCHNNGFVALECLPRARPDVILMDIKMAGMSGIECTQKLAAILPGSRVIMLTALEDKESLFRSLMAGAFGYLVKPVPSAELIRAIKDVSTGGTPLSQAVARILIDSFHSRNWPHGSLSQREQAIVACLFEGLLDKEIAARLGKSITTVRTHVQRLFHKFNVSSRRELLEKYLEIGGPPKSK